MQLAVRENAVITAHLSKIYIKFLLELEFNMAVSALVSCINKTFHQDPHSRITNIGGIWTDGAHWKIPQEQAISDIESGKFVFCVIANGKSVRIVIATHNGRKYIKTENDGLYQNNLLSLPECL